MRRDLLERQTPSSQWRHRDELEAAPPGLAGERPRQREDGPQRGDDREDRAVLPLDIATQGVHVERLAGDSARLPLHLVASRATSARASTVGNTWPMAEDTTNRRPRGEPGDDEDREPRVTERLGEHRAEAVDAAPGGIRAGVAGVVPGVGRVVAVMPRPPPRASARTARGRSPRASARGSRSRAARGARPPGRPG